MAKIDEALTVTQAAKVKGITRQAMHYAVKHGKVKTVSALGQVGILPEDLIKYAPNPLKTGSRSNGKSKKKDARQAG